MSLSTGYASETTNEADNVMLTQVIVKLEDRAIPMESNTTDNYTTVDLQEEFYLTSSVGKSKMYSTAEAINVDTRPAMTNLVINGFCMCFFAGCHLCFFIEINLCGRMLLFFKMLWLLMGFFSNSLDFQSNTFFTSKHC